MRRTKDLLDLIHHTDEDIARLRAEQAEYEATVNTIKGDSHETV